ncbi:hypothetical protein FAES_5394 [Fibrella aestuarina BUZ 2]|uniref:Uncharacterized protein n=1 Tax=Fibrella aestuarina BUZ 2 TaxID=1166018 RepID=I0KGZ0_9BACT|nr:hypothetical protein [Fibrella aestuarina]CCH03393.1 hypothetical protein FAES_5394 [Fibrella aestuarina BUZ 2]
MKTVLHSLFLLCLTAAVGLAQVTKLSDKPDQFLPDLKAFMARGGPEAVKATADLESIWTDGMLTPAQRERLMVLCRQQVQKRYQPTAQFVPLFAAIYHIIYTAKPAVNPPDIDNLLTVAEKQFAQNDQKAYTRTVEAMRAFLQRRELYAAKYNKTFLLGGTFEFRYVEPGTTTGQVSSTQAAVDLKNEAQSRFDGWDAPVGIDSTQPKQIGVLYKPIPRRPIPAVVGPVVMVSNAHLAIVANGDSALVNSTSGYFLLKDGIWVGKGGTFSWALQGKEDRFVTLSDYSMVAMNPRMVADDVTLTYEKGSKPISGAFEYVSKKRYTNRPDEYPRFASYRNNEVIPNLGAGISYKGGLALAGLQLIGASADGQPAVLTIQDQNKKTALKLISRKFEFVDSLITASAVQLTGYLYESDSLTHPSVQFKFDKTTRTAWFNRVDRTGYGRVPFADSYHKFFVVPEVVRWEVAKQKIEFYQVAAKRDVPMRMESFDYFQPERYSSIAVDYGFHPIQIVANYIAKTKQQTFLDDDITNSVPNVNAAALRGALNRMVMEGYLDRDPRTGTLRLSRKGALYYFAYNDKSDYDNFEVKSYFNTNDSLKNATINLTDPKRYLVVRGVDRFTISDSLKLYGMPADKTLRIAKGRSLVFTGQMKSGNMRYNGVDLAFDYDKFGLNMNKINSITFTPQKLADQGRTDEIGGDIKYDKPGSVFFATADNKSGRMKGKKTTQRLVMPEGMTAYFDQEDRGDRRYDRKVYFKIPAIDNDSVGKGDISFVGTFHSGGIMPPFQAELKTMPDQTLGFVHTPPAGGYPVYGSKSNVKFAGDITMDKKGLQAAGTLNHLAASLTTKELLFMPDSVIASGATGQIVESQTTKVAAAPAKKGQRVVRQPSVAQTYYPNVALNDFSMKWWPQADSMVITTQKNSFTFFNATTKLEGNLLLRASGLFGNGVLTRTDSEVRSESIKFNRDGYSADDAKFQILALNDVKGVAPKPVLVGTALNVDFDQVKGLVDLATNLDNRSVEDTLRPSMEFPYAAYKTNINRAQWNVKNKTIAMRGDVKTSTFTATAEEQEGLTFNAGSAQYDIDKMMLNVGGVPYVTSADARIYPEKGQVTIRRNGEMMPFKNARLEMDTTTLFHRMSKANIQVASRTRFTGDATYLFATAKGDTASIKMGSFELKEAKPDEGAVAKASSKPVAGRKGKRGADKPLTTYYTVASADIDENDKLMLAPKMQFKGTVLVKAPEKDLALDGFIKPALKKRPALISGWIPFKEKVIETIEIPVNDKLKNDGDQVLVAGLQSRYGSPGIYPTFMSPKEDNRDDDIFRAEGYMRYDEKDKTFRIGTKLGTEGLGDDFDNTFLFNDEKGIMTFRGAMNLLATRPNQYLLASGSARANVDSSTYRINALMALTFAIPEPINTLIAGKLVEANLEERNDTPADDDLNRISDKMLPLIGKKAVDDYRNRAQNQHVVLSSASPKLNTSLVLADANLRWSELHNAFYSVGKLGVSNIQTADINAQMDGYIEIRKGGNGDELSLYLASSPDVWVFYDYRPAGGTGGQLAIVTSEQEINDRITALLRNSKSTKTSLAIVPGDMEDKSAFVERYEIQYKVRTKPKTAPKPKAKPAPTEPTVAKEADGFGGETEPTSAPTAKPAKGKAATKATTAKAEPAAADEEATDPAATPTAEPAPKTKATGKGKTATAKTEAAKGKPTVAKKEPPKPKEEKKDKEDEKEGF